MSSGSQAEVCDLNIRNIIKGAFALAGVPQEYSTAGAHHQLLRGSQKIKAATQHEMSLAVPSRLSGASSSSIVCCSARKIYAWGVHVQLLCQIQQA